jgi:serine/threonine-protein kinase RsbW
VAAVGHRTTSDQRHAAELIVSELVTNAVRYGRSPIDLAIYMVEGDHLLIEVSDADPTPPIARLPCESGGFGLSIVSAYADISVTSTETGKVVSAYLKICL